MALKPNRTAILFTLILVGVLLGAWWVFSHNNGGTGPESSAGKKSGQEGLGGSGSQKSGRGKGINGKPVPVVITPVMRRNIPIQLEALGHVEAVSAITVKAQVNGIIQQVYFKEGALVKKGQLLFQIDPQPFQQELNQALAQVQKDQAQVNQARATLTSDQAQVRAAMATVAKDQAQLDLARVQEQRFQTLLEKDFISRDQLDQARTTRLAAEATLQSDQAIVARARAQTQYDLAAIANAQAVVEADQAAAQGARINLGYTRILAPIAGKTGSLSAHVGDVVTANTSPLVTLVQLQPVYISFTIPEQSFSLLQKANSSENKAKVIALLPSSEENPEEQETGILSFVDNTVDVSTGTLRLRGTFPNAYKRLWAGQFINLRLVLGTEKQALVVPNTAVLNGQQGKYVFVPENGKALYRAVTTGRSVDEWVAITRGLRAGEPVITEGQSQLAPGLSIAIKPGV